MSVFTKIASVQPPTNKKRKDLAIGFTGAAGGLSLGTVGAAGVRKGALATKNRAIKAYNAHNAVSLLVNQVQEIYGKGQTSESIANYANKRMKVHAARADKATKVLDLLKSKKFLIPLLGGSALAGGALGYSQRNKIK